MRFGQLEVRTIATLIASRFALELPEDFKLEYRQMPTISPKHGMPMLVRERSSEGRAQRESIRERVGALDREPN